MKKIIALAIVGIIGSVTNQQAFSQGVPSLTANQIKIGAVVEKPGLILEKYDVQTWQGGRHELKTVVSLPAFGHKVEESRERFLFNSPPKATETYYVHPSAVIVNGPILSPTEKKMIYWASRTGFGFLRRRTGTYATGRYPETSALTSHATGPRHLVHSPR